MIYLFIYLFIYLTDMCGNGQGTTVDVQEPCL
jgi:hypothetical protein